MSNEYTFLSSSSLIANLIETSKSTVELVLPKKICIYIVLHAIYCQLCRTNAICHPPNSRSKVRIQRIQVSLKLNGKVWILSVITAAGECRGGAFDANFGLIPITPRTASALAIRLSFEFLGNYYRDERGTSSCQEHWS